MISDRGAYLLIAEDYGGVISTSAHPPLNYMVAVHLESDDKEAAGMALAALANAGIIKLAGRSAEIIQTVDPATLSDDPYDWIEIEEEPAGDAPADAESVVEVDDQVAGNLTPEAEIETAAENGPGAADDTPAAAPPPISTTPAVLSKRPARPAKIKAALPFSGASRAARSLALTQRPIEGPTPRWQSASGNRSEAASYEDKQLAAARRKIRRLEAEQHRLERRLTEEQAKREEAEAHARSASSAKSRLRSLQILVVALRAQIFYTIGQMNVELATLRQQLAEANGTIRNLEQDIAQAAAAGPARHRELEAQVARLTQEVSELAQAKQELEGGAITLRRLLVAEEEAHNLCLDENEQLIDRLQQCAPIMQRYLEASRRPVRLSCGHKIITMVDSADHIPGIRQGCNRTRTVEEIGAPPPLIEPRLPGPTPASRPAPPKRRPQPRRHRRK